MAAENLPLDPLHGNILLSLTTQPDLPLLDSRGLTKKMNMIQSLQCHYRPMANDDANPISRVISHYLFYPS